MKRDSKLKLVENKSELYSEIDNISQMSLMGLLKFGSQTLLAEAIREEIRAYLGRDFYEHNNSKKAKSGYRHGYRNTRVDTPIGSIEYDRPRLIGARGFKSKFHSPYLRRPEEFASAICDMYVNGVSTRKIKSSLKSITGKGIKLSRSTVSRITKKLINEFKSWKRRDLSEVNVVYLFFDAIRIGMRIGGKNLDSVFIAFGILEDGSFEVLSISVGNSENAKSWGIFANDLKRRGLKDPLLAVSDGNASLIKSIESNFPTSYRQRCVKHKIDNVLSSIRKEDHPKAREMLNAIFYGSTSLAQSKLHIENFKNSFHKRYPTAVEILQYDLDQCLTFFLFPPKQWQKIRTSNKIERLHLEIRRRLNVIGRHPSEDGCLSLIFHVAKNYSHPQQGMRVDDLTKQLWKKLREEKVAMLEQLELDLYAA